MDIKVGLKLCGNCNPEIDVKKLLRIIKSMLRVDFVSYEEHSYDLLLLIHSCATACANCMNNGSKLITATGFTCNGNHFRSEKELAKEIVREIGARISEV